MKMDRGVKNAYTLVEVLIVASIIGVLASFLLNAAINSRKKANLTKTHALLESISAALRMYQDDFGTYPPQNVIYRYGTQIAASSADCLYYYLGATFKRGVNASIFAGPYMKFTGDELQTTQVSACDFDGDGAIDDDLKRILDPWGQALRFRSSPTQNLSSFDLYSLGPDKTNNSGSGDDINNWE